ncbi:hypothetical protein K435DRAFT_769680 [Dendrothele bispora CBS 962.96]|uniref:Uncharacterized protein n=1 Tax=Dendrothele bispora (strain CBS 962.96) TaxID=1314807 RepID=A0A4V4HB62_DENBC|nr:hypothetical protein K435DRAFT_769680 [Dendrothele bispora CBS 962.96]
MKENVRSELLLLPDIRAHRDAYLEVQEAENELLDEIREDLEVFEEREFEMGSGSVQPNLSPPHDPVPVPDETQERRSRKHVLPTKYSDFFVISNESAFVKRRKHARTPPEEAETPEHLEPSSLPKSTIMSPRQTPSPVELENLDEHSISQFQDDTQQVESDDTPPFIYKTKPDSMNMFRIYQFSMPSRIPDLDQTTSDVTDAPTFITDTSQKNSEQSNLLNPLSPTPSFFSEAPPPSLSMRSYAPFDSAAEFLIVDWSYHHPSNNSSSLNSLVNDVLRNPDFRSSIDALDTFNAESSLKKMDKFVTSSTLPQLAETSEDSSSKETFPFLSAAPDMWYSGEINLPMPHKSNRSEATAPHLKIKEVWYCKPVDAIRASFEEEIFFDYHLKSYKSFYNRSVDGRVERVYSEAYTSNRAAEMEEDLNSQFPNPSGSPGGGLSVENVIVWIMLWSDSTHLAHFGTASLWPIYMYIGNLSKYVRIKPSAYAAHHLAYIPSLPDLVTDAYEQEFGCTPTDAVLRFLKREIIHVVYFLLLDPDFLEAYLNGLLVMCADKIIRRLFPRFFSYSADYPERILIACIKYLGEWLCTRCLIRMPNVNLLGLTRDMANRERLRRIYNEQLLNKIEKAREFIFEKGHGPESKAVKDLLDHGSLTPCRNAFSTVLGPHGFDVFKMIVPEKLHEWDVGRVKDFLSHLVRILHCRGKKQVNLFDRRFRWVPTFGRGVIRIFHNNVSGMKKLAGRDYTAILECLLPVVEGLLPEKENKVLLRIIFDMLTWNSHAKLRLHTDSSVSTFKIATRDLGMAFRLFVTDICSSFDTVELPRERTARLKREASQDKELRAQGSKKKTFRNDTVKNHMLGYYPWAVTYYGPNDSHDTKIGEQEHKRVKRYYSRTNKHNHAAQIANHERRVRCLHRARQRNAQNQSEKARTCLTVGAWEEEKLPPTDPYLRYQMASEKRYFLDLTGFEHETRHDPAATEFLHKLKHYVLCQLFGRDSSSDFMEEEYNALTFESNRIYKHKTIRVNSTQYNGRRNQDSINPRTHPDIMVLSPSDSEHPFLYGRAVGLFHANARFSRPRGSLLESIPLKRIDMVWVRWFEYDSSHAGGWQAKQLHRIKFVHASDPDAFGFLHPSDIVRSVHLIPAFHYGDTDNGLPENSVGRQFEATSWSGRELEVDDWLYYYVNMFVDSDIFMLFRGGGIGHQELHEHLQPFYVDAGLDNLVLPVYDSDGEEVQFDDPGEGSLDGSSDEDVEVEGTDHAILTDEENEGEDSEEELSDGEWMENLGPEDGDNGIGLLDEL